MFLNFLAKQNCLVCSRTSKEKICKNCTNQFIDIPSPFCDICKSIEIEKNQCQECLKREPLFKNLTVIGMYSGLLKSLIYNYKYEGIKEYSVPFANLLSDKLKNEYKKFDIITSVPLHEERIKKRGFNQSELLGKSMAKNLKKQYVEAFLRIKNTKPQFSLSSKEREENLKNAFILNQSINIKNKNVLIVDDIFTTGTTLQEASKLLLDNKANEIYLAAIARSIK